MSQTTKADQKNYEPYIDITSGVVTPSGGLQKDQPFWWYNPNANDVAITIGNCGTWCVDSEYIIPAGGQYAEAQVLASPNQNQYAWVEDPSTTWTAGGGGPHVGAQSGAPGTPIINIQTGAVTGTLVPGQAFSWNNPNPGTVEISSCGPWCADSSYSVTGSGLTAASMAANPDGEPLAWTESPNRWDTPGMPHTQGPIHVPAKEHERKEVA